MKKLKKIMGLIVTIVSTVVVLCSCDTDKDENGVDDRIESEGVYTIDAAGYEDIRKEEINIIEVRDENSGTIAGSIYANKVDKTFEFYSQDVTISEYEGNIWYTTVTCTDGYRRRIYFRRAGIGNYISSGGASLGADALGSGGSFGINWTSVTYDEYGRILYCIYSDYSYLK